MEQTIRVHRSAPHRFDLPDGSADELRPKQLMLLALGRCSGLTAEALLEKMRIPFTAFSVDTSGVLTDPAERADSVYVALRQEFRIAVVEAKDVPRAVHAIALAAGKYCGVGLMFGRFAPIAVEIWVNGAKMEAGENVA